MATKKAGKGTKAKSTKASAKKVVKAAATAPKGRKPAEVDTRLPAVGTTIAKRDRHGEFRSACRVEAEGIKYNGQLYSSLSGAAMAAAQDLGLKNKTQNGFVFWGLSKPAHGAGAQPESPEADACARWQRRRRRMDEPNGARALRYGHDGGGGDLLNPSVERCCQA